MNEIIKLLLEAKQQYEERTELSEHCLCHFLYYLTDRKVPVILEKYIKTHVKDEFSYYKNIWPVIYFTTRKLNMVKKQIEGHYAARLELINICINHFNSLQ
jgi:hypothetical protein